MTKNILICNQKGGTGKSTLADILLWAFEKDGIPVAFYDLDNQGGVIHRSSEKSDIKKARIAVIDTPGALQEQLREWMKKADIIIIPTKPTMVDMEPLIRMMDLVKNVKCTIVYVEMMWNRFKTATMFDSWLRNEVGESRIFKIPQSEQVTQAAAMGQSVIDYAPKSSAAVAASELVKYVRELINI